MHLLAVFFIFSSVKIDVSLLPVETQRRMMVSTEKLPLTFPGGISGNCWWKIVISILMGYPSLRSQLNAYVCACNVSSHDQTEQINEICQVRKLGSASGSRVDGQWWVFFFKSVPQITYKPEVYHTSRRLMAGRLLFFWDGNLSGAMFKFRGCVITEIHSCEFKSCNHPMPPKNQSSS